MLDLPPATLNPQATHDPCRNLADHALREAVRAPPLPDAHGLKRQPLKAAAPPERLEKRYTNSKQLDSSIGMLCRADQKVRQPIGWAIQL